MDLGNLGISQLSLDKRNLSLASEKDLKTCANIDTKFQQVILSQSPLHLHPNSIKISSGPKEMERGKFEEPGSRPGA